MLMERLRGPWEQAQQFNFQITAQLQNSSAYTDRCIHTFTMPEEPNQLASINLDWQRTLNSGKTINKGTLQNVINEASGAALDYFEKVGEGSLFP